MLWPNAQTAVGKLIKTTDLVIFHWPPGMIQQLVITNKHFQENQLEALAYLLARGRV
jgi:hypothetical protein